MATGVIRIFFVSGTRFCEGLAADTAAFSGECFSSLVWLCETKAKSHLSQIYLFLETSKSGMAKTECYSQVSMLSQLPSLGGVRCWTWLQFLHCREELSHPVSLWKTTVKVPISACPSRWRRKHCVSHIFWRHTWPPVEIFYLLKDRWGDEEQIIADQPDCLWAAASSSVVGEDSKAFNTLYDGE